MIKDDRLYSIASLIDKNSHTLLDIGVDHGYLIKIAFDNNKIKKAIAADINEKPLNSAKANLINYNVTYVLSNGFEKINDEFDVVVISGLGANTIKDILKLAPKDNITYILQANNKVERLRKYLSSNNFKIIDEVLVYENDRYYVILKVVRGNQTLSEEEIYLGPVLMNKKSSKAYYQHQLDHYNDLINNKNAKEMAFKDEILLLKSILNK